MWVGIIIYFDLINIIHLSERSLHQAIKGYVILFPKLTIYLLIALAVIAMIDFIWQKHSHNEKLKMSIKEIKDEMKDTDGSPEVKQKIRKQYIEFYPPLGNIIHSSDSSNDCEKELDMLFNENTDKEH